MEPVSDSDYSDDDQSSSYSDSDDNMRNEALNSSQHKVAGPDEESDFNSDSDSMSNESSQDEDPKVLWKGNMSLEELMALRDKVGIKKFNKDMMNSTKPSLKPSSAVQKKKPEKKRFKREHKRRPQELSSKIKVPKLRQVVTSSKPKFSPRDPRFDDLCGSQFNEESFDKDYSFLDNIREREVKELKRTLDNTSNPAEKKKLRYLIRRMREQKRAKQHRNIMRQVEEEHRKSEIEKIEKGIKNPYFLTKKKRKELYEQKKAEIAKEQGIDNSKKNAVKKEKKLKQKEKKHMPFKRRLET